MSILHHLRLNQNLYVLIPRSVHVPPHIKQHSLTAGLLQGPGRMITPPLAFVRRDEQDMETYVHVGRSLCGHDGIIHGGLLATILDEAMARIVRDLHSSGTLC